MTPALHTIPRGRRADDAAQYLAISKATLLTLLRDDPTFPAPRVIRSIKVWDRRELDRYFDRLPNAHGTTPAGNSNVGGEEFWEGLYPE